MPSTTRSGPNSVLSPVGWCVFFLIVALYGGFALAMGFNEALFLLGLGPELKHRAAPLVFVIHALTGAVALFVGPLQSIRWIRRRAAVRRTLGISYVVAVWLAGYLLGCLPVARVVAGHAGVDPTGPLPASAQARRVPWV